MFCIILLANKWINLELQFKCLLIFIEFNEPEVLDEDDFLNENEERKFIFSSRIKLLLVFDSDYPFSVIITKTDIYN
jgi:hypothetical protein